MRTIFTLRTILTLLLLALASLLGAADALADVVGPPPSTCPRGGEPESSHAGPYCAIKRCSSSTSCQDPETCRSEALCIVEIQGGSMGGPFTVKSVVGSCDAQGRCSKGSCETHQVCAPPPDDGTPNRGCECGVGDAPGFAGLALLLGLGLWLALRRRAPRGDRR